MDDTTFLGMAVTVIVMLGGFYISLRKYLVEQNKPINELTKAIVELNLNFNHMLENDEIRDKHIEEHGKEIYKIVERQRENEKILNIHDFRLGNLEREIGKPFEYKRKDD